MAESSLGAAWARSPLPSAAQLHSLPLVERLRRQCGLDLAEPPQHLIKHLAESGGKQPRCREEEGAGREKEEGLGKGGLKEEEGERRRVQGREEDAQRQTWE